MLREFHEALEKFEGCARARGIIRIVYDDCLRPFEDGGGNRIEVGQEAVFGFQLEVVDLPAQIFCVRAEYGIAWNRHYSDVARVDEAAGENREGGLGAYRVEDFRLGVELNPEHGLHISRRRLFEVGAAVVGIPAVCGVFRRRIERFYNFRKRHLVGFAHAHVDEFHPGLGGLGRALCPLYLFKFVYGGALPVVNAADSLGEEVLYV